MVDAAVGQATPNAQYLGNRLVYDRELESSFDPLGNTRLLIQFGMHALLYWAVYTAGALLSWIVLLIIGLLGLGFTAASTLGLVGSAIFGLLFLCLFWLIPLPVQLSEWKFFVDGKGSVAPAAFDHIAWALQQRQTPLDNVRVRRLALPAGETRDYLEIRRAMFVGMISCFAYGRDLYLGWTFWFRISPLGYLVMYVSRLWQVITHRGNDMYVTLRYDYARAMREAMHSAAREGVDAAVGRARPQGQGLGGSLQVEVADFTV